MTAEATATARRRRIGPGVIVLIAVAVPLLLAALFVVSFKVSGRRGLNAELERIRAAGEPVSAGELEVCYQAPPSDRDMTQLWLQALAPLDTPQFNSEARSLPIVGEGPEPILWPGEPWPELVEAEKLLAQYGRSLELMHQAARQGGQARYPTKFADGMSMLLTHVQQLRGGARLLALESAVEAHRARPAAAIDSILAIFAAARSLEQEPVLISQLVRMALDGMARDRAAWLLSAIQLDDAQLARLEVELAARNYYGRPVYQALLGERVMGIDAFANPARLGDEGKALALLGAVNGDRDRTLYLQLMGELIAAAKTPAEQGRQTAANVEARLKQVAGSGGSRFSHPLTLLLMPAVSAVFEARSRNEAARVALRVAVAVERFRRTHDRLPEKLDELTPTYFGAVPFDPYDIKPLRYRIDGEEYVVYSVGKDQIDQKGLSEPPNKADDIAVRVRIQKDTAPQ
jgi:hypothetical protein